VLKIEAIIGKYFKLSMLTISIHLSTNPTHEFDNVSKDCMMIKIAASNVVKNSRRDDSFQIPS